MQSYNLAQPEADQTFGAVRWHGAWVLLVLAIYLALWNLPWFQMLGGLGQGSTAGDSATTREYVSLFVSAGIKLVAAAAALAVIYGSGTTSSAIGVPAPANALPWRVTWTGWLLPILWLALVAGALRSVTSLEGPLASSRSADPPLTQPLVLTTLLLRGVLNPLSEELIYRVLVYLSIRRWLGAALATVLSSVVFGLVHYNGGFHQQILALILGLAVAWFYERTQSLPQACFLHSSLNVGRLLLGLSQGHL